MGMIRQGRRVAVAEPVAPVVAEEVTPRTPVVVAPRTPTPVVEGLEAAALAALADDPRMTGADLGRTLGVTPPTGQRLELKLAEAVA